MVSYIAYFLTAVTDDLCFQMEIFDRRNLYPTDLLFKVKTKHEWCKKRNYLNANMDLERSPFKCTVMLLLFSILFSLHRMPARE